MSPIRLVEDNISNKSVTTEKIMKKLCFPVKVLILRQ